MPSRPKAPRCHVCGKALYRTKKAREKRISDEYLYCRNVNCYENIKNKNCDINKEIEYRENKKTSNFDNKAPKLICEKCGRIKCICERESITITRNIIKGTFNSKDTKAISAMSITIILQEMGDDDIAEMLINRYELDNKYGLRRTVK